MFGSSWNDDNEDIGPFSHWNDDGKYYTNDEDLRPKIASKPKKIRINKLRSMLKYVYKKRNK